MTALPPDLPSPRRFAARIAVFAAGTLALLVVAEAAARALTADELEPKFAELFAGRTDWEGVVLGTSHAAFGIVPALLDRPGERWFNFAVSGASDAYFQDWWALYRATGRKPKRVLYGADWFLLGGSLARRLENEAEFLPPALWLRWLLDPARAQGTLVLSSSAIYKQRPVWLYGLTHVGGPRISHPDLARLDRGFAPLVPSPAGLGPASKEVAAAQPHLEARFEAQIAAWQAEGVAVDLVQTPEYGPLVEPQPFANAVLARIAARRGVRFLDYNGDRRSPLNDRAAAFVDWGHLSGEGAETFTRQLARDLKTGSR